MAAIVQGKQLLQTVIASLIAGAGITILFSIAIYATTRFAELSRDERGLAAALAAVVGVLSALACVAAIVLGLIVMAAK